MIVNVVSQIPSTIWDREVPPDTRYSFIHSEEPVEADVHVIYGLRRSLKIPNSPPQMVFIASEPPEIRQYNRDVLGLYGTVAGPRFSYLLDLPSFSALEAVAPWWVGTAAGGAVNHYETAASTVTISRPMLEEGFSPDAERISTIVSNKARTPLQQQRLRLVDYLLRHLPEFEAFGLEHTRVADKAEALSKFRYHLAVENSSHDAYWTEKLADPVLMDNYVFYFGDPAVSVRFNPASIRTINPWDPEATYGLLSHALDVGAWKSSSNARRLNRRKLLNQHSFHRAIEPLLDSLPVLGRRTAMMRLPPQNPKSRVKTILDPFYRATRRLLYPKAPRSSA